MNLQELKNGEIIHLANYNCCCKKNKNYLSIVYQGEKYKVFKENIMQKILNSEIPEDKFDDFLRDNAEKAETENQYKVGLSDFQWKIVEDGGQNEFKIKDVSVSNKGDDTCIVKFVYPNEATTGGRYYVTISRSDNVIITDYPPSKKLNIQKNLDKKEQEKFFELLKENNKQNELIELLQGKAISNSQYGDTIKQTPYIPESYIGDSNYNVKRKNKEPHDELPKNVFERLSDLSSGNFIGDGRIVGDDYYFTSFGLPISINNYGTLSVLDVNSQNTFTKSINGDDFYCLINSIKQNNIDDFIKSALMYDENSTIETLPDDQTYQYYTYNDYTPKNCNYSYSDNFYNSINTYNDNSTYYTNNYNYF